MKKKYIPLAAVMSAACLMGGCAQESQDTSTETVDAVKLVADIPTTQYFTDKAIAEGDIDTILMAGINAPSAINKQPWHFSVITDAAVLQQISDDMSSGMPFGTPPKDFVPPADTEGSTPPEGLAPPAVLDKDNAPEDFAYPLEDARPAPGLTKAGLTDAPLAIVISCAEGSELDAGLACQNMSVTAQLLGYGTKIISSPTIALNGEKQVEYKELLGIPAEQQAAAILLVGMEDTSVDTTADGYTGATERNPLDKLVTYITAE